MYKILFLVIISANFVYSQLLPKDFRFGKNSLSKTEDVLPTSNNIEDILIVGDTVWLATGNGLSRSTDNGETWTNYFGTEAFGSESVATLGYYKGTIWVSTWHFEEGIGEDVPAGSGLRFSNDGGDNWQVVNQPVDDPGDSVIIYGTNNLRALPVTVIEQNFVRGMSFTPNTIWITSFSGGLRKSSDNGKTWERVVLPPDNLDSIHPDDTLNFALQPVAGNFGPDNNLNHRVFSVLAVDDNTIYVGTAGGINKSTDGGISWKKFNRINQEQPISGNFVLKMRYNDVDSSLWATTWKAEGETEFWAASRTTNGGQSWETFLPGERPHDFAFVDNGSGTDVLVATENGVFRTSNNSSTWISNPQIFDDISKVKIVSENFRSVQASQKLGSNFIWIGSTRDGLARLEEPIGNFWNGNWKVFLASDPLENGIKPKAFPNPFSPEITELKIQYTTKGNNADVTVRIFDFDMNLVKTLRQNAQRDGSLDVHTEFWNGRDESGNIVPNGVYFYRIDLNSNEPQFGKIIVLR